MSTLAYFGARPDYGMGRAFLLAFAVHALLLAVMFIGVRMQNRPGETVTVELWEAPPPPPPPVVEAPKPPPQVEPPKPKPEPEPEVKKPDIAEKAPPPKPKPKPKPEAKKDDEIQKILMREQVALEQRKVEDERKKLDERRRLDDARRKADAERTARELASTARNRALGQWTDKIRGKVRGNIILPQDINGNPEAIFDVALLPTGEVLSVRKRKSSGHAAYDEAVERAIHKSSPFPQPDQPNLFQRNLELKFRPLDP